MKNFFDQVNANCPENELASLREVIAIRMAAVAKMNDQDEVAVALLDAEREAILTLAEISESYRVIKPRGLGLSKPLRRDWNAYTAETERLKKEHFDPFGAEIAQKVSTVANVAKIYLDQRKRLGELIRQQAESGKKVVAAEAGQLRICERYSIFRSKVCSRSDSGNAGNNICC